MKAKTNHNYGYSERFFAVHTDWAIIRSRTSWEVAEEAKEKVLPESLADSSSSVWQGLISGMTLLLAESLLSLWLWRNGGVGEGANALHTLKAEELHDLERNSMGSIGLSGNWIPPGEFLSDHCDSIIFEKKKKKRKTGDDFGLLSFGDCSFHYYCGFLL